MDLCTYVRVLTYPDRCAYEPFCVHVCVCVFVCATHTRMAVPADWLNLFSSPLYLSLCSQISRVERPLVL